MRLTIIRMIMIVWMGMMMTVDVVIILILIPVFLRDIPLRK